MRGVPLGHPPRLTPPSDLPLLILEVDPENTLLGSHLTTWAQILSRDGLLSAFLCALRLPLQGWTGYFLPGTPNSPYGVDF